MRNPERLLAGIFSLVGSGALAGGGWLWQEQRHFAATALHAEGEVVSLIEHRGSKGSGRTRRAYASHCRTGGAST